MKRKIFIISCVASLIAILSLGSFTFFTTTGTAKNQITAGNVRLELHQDLAADDTICILPGDTRKVTTTVENTGDHPIYLRIKLSSTVSGGDAAEAEKVMLLSINNTDWTLLDGYYYYNAVLQPHEISKPIFNDVTFDGEIMNNTYMNKDMVLKISAFGVQSENNGDSPFTAAGWPEAQGGN